MFNMEAQADDSHNHNFQRRPSTERGSACVH